jgi:hypothetical protein
MADGYIMEQYFAGSDKKKGLKHNPFVTGFSIVLVFSLPLLFPNYLFIYLFNYFDYFNYSFDVSSFFPIIFFICFVADEEGIYAFGWNGFVIGPMLVFLTVVAYDLFLDHYVSPFDLETRNAIGELVS